jgi:hypothetical protein
MDCPKTPGPFHIYKVANPYLELPSIGDRLPSEVLQLPFNSTTILPNFNFYPFVAPDANCCFFDIEVPKGSHCLYIPHEYHAYPYEREILLPYDCKLIVNNIRMGTLDYVSTERIQLVTLQEQNDIRLGNVYDINKYLPCGNTGCIVEQKPFTIYQCRYENP